MRGFAVAVILLFVGIAAAGCVTPASMTAALEAPLSAKNTPFLALVTTCPTALPAGPSIVAVYPDGNIYHIRVESATEGVTTNADMTPPHSRAERVVLDVAKMGALDLDTLVDDAGRYLLVHAEVNELSNADFLDLRRRVTLAGFPALNAEYSNPDAPCTLTYGAWFDNTYWAVSDSGEEGPWTLRHVGDGLRELHKA